MKIKAGVTFTQLNGRQCKIVSIKEIETGQKIIRWEDNDGWSGRFCEEEFIRLHKEKRIALL